MTKFGILEQENKNLLKNLDDRAKELQAVKERNTQLGIQLNATGGFENIEQLRKKNAELENTLNSKNFEVQNLKTTFAEKDKNFGNMTAQIESEKVTVDHLKKEIERFSLDNNNLRKALVSKEQEFTNLKANTEEVDRLNGLFKAKELELTNAKRGHNTELDNFKNS